MRSRVVFMPFLIVCALLVTSCTESAKDSLTPKAITEQYISASFPGKGIAPERAKLLKFLSGDAKDQVALMSQNQLEKLTVQKSRELVKIKFKDERFLNPNKTFLTVELIFKESLDTKQVKINQQRLFTVENLNPDGWKVTQIRTIREFIEYEGEGLDLAF